MFFFSFPLKYVSNLIPLPHCLDYWRLLKVNANFANFLLLQDCWTDFLFLAFPYEFQNESVDITTETSGVLREIILHLYTSWRLLSCWFFFFKVRNPLITEMTDVFLFIQLPLIQQCFPVFQHTDLVCITSATFILDIF